MEEMTIDSLIRSKHLLIRISLAINRLNKRHILDLLHLRKEMRIKILSHMEVILKEIMEEGNHQLAVFQERLDMNLLKPKIVSIRSISLMVKLYTIRTISNRMRIKTVSSYLKILKRNQEVIHQRRDQRKSLKI